MSRFRRDWVFHFVKLRQNYGFASFEAAHGGEGFIGLVEGEAVGDLTGEQIAPAGGAGKELDCAVDVTWFEGPAPHDCQLLFGDDVRIEFDVAGVRVLAEDEVLAAIAAELEALWHG